MNFFAMRVARRFLGRFFWPFLIARLVFKVVRGNRARHNRQRGASNSPTERHYDYEVKK